MLAVWWFAVVGQPVFVLPLPQVVDTPAVLAIASGLVAPRPLCLHLRCLRNGWDPSTDAGMFSGNARSPFTLPRALPSTGFHGLYAPVSRRDWIASDGHDWRVGARYGFEPALQDGTRLKLEIGGGYRLEPYVDDGTSAPGPVARGRVELIQQLGPRALFRQQLRVESGRYDTYLRDVFALDLQLQSRWLLRSQVEFRRDSGGANSATIGSVQLHYTF